jgi:chemotaxis protein CheX
MTNNLYTHFLEATRNVFLLMLDLSDFSDCPDTALDNDGGLDISIGVTGDLMGEVIYRFPRDTSLNIVKIMSGMEIDTVDDFVTSAISEIANIISGNMLTELAKDDLNCDILPPVLKESSDKISDINTSCCIRTSAGNVCIDVRLNRAD